jgi:hypothetical protein
MLTNYRVINLLILLGSTDVPMVQSWQESGPDNVKSRQNQYPLHKATRPIVDGHGLGKAGRKDRGHFALPNHSTALGLPVTAPVG